MEPPSKFTERLSLFMVVIAAFGAFLVLLDPKLTLTLASGNTWSIGGEGFSADLKGAVVTVILIGGWTAVKEYWLGSSASSAKTHATMERIAEDSPTVAAAVQLAAANKNDSIKTDEINVEARVANVTEVNQKEPSS